MKRLWSSGGVLAIIGAIFFVGLIFSRCSLRHTAMPDEVKTARSAFKKLDAALSVGVPYAEYNRLLIETKTAVNAADTKLPYIVGSAADKIEFDSDGNDLQRAHRAMLDAMDRYADAQFVWDTKIQGKKLWDTPRGSQIRWDNRYPATMTEDDIQQALWSSAKTDALTFELCTNGYAQ